MRILFYLLLLTQVKAHSQTVSHQFALGDSAFLLDGKPFQIISGEMHYPRVPREAWRQRMKMARAMGLNTIGTYIFWNLHEPEKGHYDFSGNNDIAAFVKTAQEEGLWVVLRPSPYVCAEWEFGGYPYWLQNQKGLTVRSTEAQYMQAYKNYILQVGKQLAPLQIHRGGNILMVQVENEYGAYGSDKTYLEMNKRLFIEAGFDGILYTCDAAKDVAAGSLPSLLTAVNGLDNPLQVKQLVRKNNNGKGPFLIAEWYPAWFDWWGTKHHTVAPDKYAAALDAVLAADISINMYMFHGGTTRDFMNGANYNDSKPYEPQISSYDYDAPLDEAGNPTPKFFQFRNVIQKHLPSGVTLPPVPASKASMALPPISLSAGTGVFQILPKPKQSDLPLSFEDMNQAYGYALYRTTLKDPVEGVLKIPVLRDYALVFINGKRVGVLDRRLKQDSVYLKADKGAELSIVVENMGRVNYGPYLLKNNKGLIGGVFLNGKPVTNWKNYSLPFTQPSKTRLGYVNGNTPSLLSGTFTLTDVKDTYLDMRDWGKGCVWINGHSLGRYWSIGPQQTLYIPAEWLKKGDNTVQVFELIRTNNRQLKSLAAPVLDQLQTLPMN